MEFGKCWFWKSVFLKLYPKLEPQLFFLNENIELKVGMLVLEITFFEIVPQTRATAVSHREKIELKVGQGG